MTRPPTSDGPRRVLLAGSPGGAHFEGVQEALAAQKVEADLVALEETPIRDVSPYAAVALTTVLSPHSIDLLHRCRGASVPTLLLMDGLLEWRNTSINPRSGPAFLRPAPVSVVACAGEHDRSILQSMGNNAVATGLPRLAASKPLPAPEKDHLLIATARRPYFTDAERAQLLAMLTVVHEACEERALEATWRIAPDLAAALNVESSEEPLAGALARCTCVLTSPSTLALESMLAGRPTALLHPFDAPLWPLAPAWVTGESGLASTLDAILLPEEAFHARQAHALAQMAADPASAPTRVAELLIDLAEKRPGPPETPLAVTTRAVTEPAPSPATVVCVEIAGRAPSRHARHAAQWLANGDCEPLHVLVIATTPDSPFDPAVDDALAGTGLDLIDPRVSLCVHDPTRPQFLGAAVVRESLRALGAQTVAHWSTPFAAAGAVDTPVIDLQNAGQPDPAQATSTDESPERQAMERALLEAEHAGARSVAVFPSGRRAHRCAPVIEAFEKRTGASVLLIDDSALPADADAQRPILGRHIASSASPDVVVLCADGKANPWVSRCTEIVSAGVRLISACDDAFAECANV